MNFNKINLNININTIGIFFVTGVGSQCFVTFVYFLGKYYHVVFVGIMTSRASLDRPNHPQILCKICIYNK